MTSPVPRTDRPRIAVLTMVSGEHGFLLNHVDGLSVSTWPPDLHVPVSLGDRQLTRGRVPIRSDRWSTVVPRLPLPRGAKAYLPALHLAACQAVEEGAEVLVFLGVHCIPGHRLLQVLAEEAVQLQSSTPTFWHARTTLLAPSPPLGYPVAGELATLALPGPSPEPDPAPAGMGSPLADAFATTVQDWSVVEPRIRAVCGGGGTPGDLEEIVVTASGRLVQVPGETVYRQHPDSRTLYQGPPRSVPVPQNG